VAEPDYLRALSFCMLLPGPEAMQLATWIGWRLHGVPGGLIAGGLFVLPGAVVVVALSMVYAAFGTLPLVAARFGSGTEAWASGWAARWRAWNPGDAPEELVRLAREFEVSGSPDAPLAQGHLQGLLGWLAKLAEADGRGA
jgi:hypothetical protein